MKTSEYRDLIRMFLDGKFDSAESFCRTYDQTFLNETLANEELLMSKELFWIPQNFWEAVEAYSPFWEPEHIDDLHITEQTLKEAAITATDKLEKYLK